MINTLIRVCFSLGAIFFISCRSFTEYEETPTMRMEASADASKTILQNGYKVLWTKEDAIMVNGCRSIAMQTLNDGERAIFVVPESSGPYHATYPASAYCLGKMYLPQSQMYYKNSFDPAGALMMACSDDYNLQFNSVVSFLKINIQGIDDKDDIYKIIVEARGGENMSGALSLDFNKLSATSALKEGRTVQIQSETGIKQGLPIYLSVPVGTYSKGWMFKVIDVNNHLYEASTPENESITTHAGEITTINASFIPQESSVIPFPDAKLSVLTSTNHPRLLITDAAMSEIQAKLSENSIVSKIHDIVIRQADFSLKQEVFEFPPESEQRNMLTLCRSAITQIWSCSYAYRYTKDKKYLNHAVAQLTAVCNFPSWLTERSSLNMAEMCTAVAIGYDWLYESLTPDQKKMIETAIDTYAFTTTLNGQYSTNFFEAKSNWEPVCCGGLTLAALATYETLSQKASRILEKCTDSNQTLAPIFYKDNGNSGEGYGYWIFGSSYQVMMNYALESTIGFDYGWRIQGYDKTASFFHNLESPNHTVFNYSDSSPISIGAGIPLWYLAYKQGDPTILSYEIEKLDMTYYTDVKKDGVRLLAMILPWVCKTDFYNIQHPSTKLYYSEGRNCIAIGRTSWYRNGSFFGFKGGFGCKTHGHLDVGSFVFESQGERWAYDIGNPKYTEIEPLLEERGGDFWDMGQNSLRWTVNSMNNFYHNTLTIGGVLHDVTGLAVITGISDTAEEMSCTMDLSEVFNTQVKTVSRKVALNNRDELHILDSVSSYSNKSAPLEWRMVTKAKVEILDDYIKLQLNGKTEYLKVTSNTHFKYKIFSNAKQHDYDMDLSSYNIVGFSANIPSNAECSFETILSTSLK